MNKKTIFTMYAGLRTIGGVIFSVTYGKDRVIMEFGSAYDPATAVFDGKVLSRKENWIRDRLKIGLLPKIDGIYRKEDLGDYPLISAEESDMNTAMFVTHPIWTICPRSVWLPPLCPSICTTMPS